MPPAIVDTRREDFRSTFAIITDSIEAAPYCKTELPPNPSFESAELLWPSRKASQCASSKQVIVWAQAPPIPRLVYEYVFLGSFAFIGFVLLLAFLGAFKDCLQWLEHQSTSIIFCSCTLLYVLLSLPLAFGYILLNLATGYLCGLLSGILLTIASVAIGNTVAFLLMRTFWGARMSQLLRTAAAGNPYVRTILEYVSHPSWNDVALMRILPIPFGIQNAVFVASDITVQCYVAATFLGLLPTQILNVAMGSRLRSMRDVLAGGGTVSSWDYLFYGLQISSLFLVVFLISNRARRRLTRYSIDEEATAGVSMDKGYRFV